MHPFIITIGLILYGLTAVCFVLTFKSDKKQIATSVGIILTIIITLTLIGNLDMLVVFIWPIILMFQLVFISYWFFRLLNKKKIGTLIALALTTAFALLVLNPWIKDWLFNENDARRTLSIHSIELKDDFKILQNETWGFRDYYETFTLKLSDKDFDRIADQIKSTGNYKGIFTDNSDLPFADYDLLDTVDFETDREITREYWIDKEKMVNGTYHFTIQLNKHRKELIYTGSDE